jgi:hypothetical protein
MTMRDPALLRVYVLGVGALLLVQGTLSVFLHGTRFGTTESTHGLITVSLRHAAIHVAWGLATAALVLLRADDRVFVAFAAVFVVFYGALTVLGLALEDPFGLPLGIGENAFHAIITTGAVAVLALRALTNRPAPAPGR